MICEKGVGGLLRLHLLGFIAFNPTYGNRLNLQYKRSGSTLIPNPTPRSWQIGVGIGIEKSAHSTPCFAKYLFSNVENHGPHTMNHVQLELMRKTQRFSLNDIQ